MYEMHRSIEHFARLLHQFYLIATQKIAGITINKLHRDLAQIAA
jgi:hypothetical protein